MERKHHLIQHFYYGKLETNTGTGFEIVAASSGLIDFNDYLYIPVKFSLDIPNQPKMIEHFSGAYAWYPWNSELAILGHFQRSPNIEYSGRPYYFIQAHYLVIPPQLTNLLQGNFRPLFDLFTDIPRYQTRTELAPLEWNTSTLQNITKFSSKEQISEFVPYLFEDKLVVFKGENLNPIERLNYLCALVSCFPPAYRLKMPYTTSAYDSSTRNSLYRLATLEDNSQLGHWPDFHNPPSFDRAIPGMEYKLWFQKQEMESLEATFFDKLRGIESGRMLSLDRAATFDRRWTKLHTLDESGLTSKLLSTFIAEYMDLLHEDEIEEVLTNIIRLADESDLVAISNTLIILHHSFDTRFFNDQLILNISQTTKLNVNDIVVILDNITSSEPEGQVANAFLQAMTVSLVNNKEILPYCISAFKWMIYQDKRETYLQVFLSLLCILVEQGAWLPVLRSEWGLVTDFIQLRNSLSKNAREVLRNSAPRSFELIRYLAGDKTTNLNVSSLIADSFQEVDSIDWLLASLFFAIHEGYATLFSSTLFGMLIDLLRIEAWQPMAVNILRYMDRQNFFEKLTTVETESAAPILESVRNFLVEVARLKATEVQLSKSLSRIGIHLFQSLSHQITQYKQAEFSLDERDKCLLAWADLHKNTWPKDSPSIDAIRSIEPMNLYQPLVGTFLALVYDYPSDYLPLFAEYANSIEITQSSLFIWIAIIKYEAKYPTQILNNIVDEKSAATLLDRIINILIQYPPHILYRYIYMLSTEIRFIPLFEALWMKRLSRLYLHPSLPYDSEQWDWIAEQLASKNLRDEAKVLKRMAATLRQFRNDEETAREILKIIISTQTNLNRLLEYADYIQSLNSNDTKEVYLDRIGFFLTESTKSDFPSIIDGLRLFFHVRGNITKVSRLLNDVQKSIKLQLQKRGQK